jgi:hypothetical protein
MESVTHLCLHCEFIVDNKKVNINGELYQVMSLEQYISDGTAWCGPAVVGIISAQYGARHAPDSKVNTLGYKGKW